MVGSAGAGGSCRWRAIPDEVLRIGLESMDLQNPAQLVTAGGKPEGVAASPVPSFRSKLDPSYKRQRNRSDGWMERRRQASIEKQWAELGGRPLRWECCPVTKMTIMTWTVEVEILFSRQAEGWPSGNPLMGNLSLANVTALLVRDSGGIWLPVHSLALVPDLVADNTTPGIDRVITLNGGGTSELEIVNSNIPQSGTEGGWLCGELACCRKRSCHRSPKGSLIDDGSVQCFADPPIGGFAIATNLRI